MTYGSQTTCFKDNFTSCNESGASTGCPESEKLNDNTNCVVVWCLEKKWSATMSCLFRTTGLATTAALKSGCHKPWAACCFLCTTGRLNSGVPSASLKNGQVLSQNLAAAVFFSTPKASPGCEDASHAFSLRSRETEGSSTSFFSYIGGLSHSLGKLIWMR